jgi:hypothetical protein
MSNLVDYREVAKERYEKFKQEKELLQLEKERIERIEIERINEQELLIVSNIIEIDENINNIEIDKTDDNVIYNLLKIKIIIENIIGYVDEDSKNDLTDKMYSLVYIINDINEKRIKDINMIDNIKQISILLKDIFMLVDIDISIISMDTTGDEEFARTLE